MEEESKNVVESTTTIQSDVKEEVVEEESMGEDIYVENDPSDLERMLGIAPSKEIPTDDEVDNVVNEEDSEDFQDDQKDEVENSRPSESNLVVLSDFMYEDPDTFTYLSKEDGSYHVNSIPMDDKKQIRQVVKSSNYIFRYPKFILKDSVLGYEVEAEDCLKYSVYFPEYSIYFEVGSEYVKPYSESFKDYFEDLVTRVRISNIKLTPYNSSLTITSLRVLETGLLEVNTDNGLKKLLLVNNNISFYDILDYIRELSDQGEDRLSLKLLPEFFKEV